LEYLLRHLHPSGQFDYLHDPLRVRAMPRYNLLRHAGTTEVLFRLAGSPFDQGALFERACLAWNYLEGHLVETDVGETACLCVIDGGKAKLGGTALTLWALTSKIACSSVVSGREAEILIRLTQYLQSQQRADGSFAAERDPHTGQQLAVGSLYYPGQAVLALCAAYRIAWHDSFLQSAIRGSSYLLSRNLQAQDGVPLCDHWQMKALAALDRMAPQSAWQARLRQLARPVTDVVRDAAAGRGAAASLTTTQMATRLEGLLAALNVVRPAGETDPLFAVRNAVLTGLSWCYERQVDIRHHRYADEGARGGFTQSPTHSAIRIDFVQHALAASYEAIAVVLSSSGSSSERA
jgi:hypothetical protein